MDRAIFLTRVQLDHYKSIAHCDVQFGPLTYLVGPNSAGKSNFLDALSFIADALNHSLDFAFRRRGGLNALIQRTSDRPSDFLIRLEMELSENRSAEYGIRVGMNEGRVEILEEQCRVTSHQVPSEVKFFHLTPDDFQSNFTWAPNVRRNRLTLVNGGGTREVGAVFDSLSRMRFYNINPSALAQIGVQSAEVLLLESGANIAEVFDRLSQANDPVKQRIEEYLRVILPTFSETRLETVGVGKSLQFWQRLGSDQQAEPFPASSMSAGTLRALGILTAVLQGNTESGVQPSLVAVEEPEAQINPAVLGVLRDAMTEASYCTQILATTHSSDLLDNTEVSTESLLAVTSDDGVTRIGEIDAGGKDLIRQHLYTPGELLRIGQLQPTVSETGTVPVGAN